MSVLTTFFEKLSSRFVKREQTRGEQFDSVVAMLADGREPHGIDVDVLLDQLGRTPADLQSAVERLVARRQAYATWQRGQAVPGEMARIEAAEKAAVAECEAAVNAAFAKRDSIMNPLAARRLELGKIERDAERARDFLYSTDPERAKIERQIRELRIEEEQRRNGVAKAVKPWGNLTQDALELRSNAHATSGDVRIHPDPSEAIRRAEMLEKKAEAIAQENAKLLAPVNELRAQIGALQTQLEIVREP